MYRCLIYACLERNLLQIIFFAKFWSCCSYTSVLPHMHEAHISLENVHK